MEYFRPVFDRARLQALTQGDRQLADRLIETFLRQLPAVRGELRSAGDRAALFDVLHQLRGSCCFIAAERLAELLDGIEGNERARKLAMSLVVDTVLGELDDIEAELQRELDERACAASPSAP